MFKVLKRCSQVSVGRVSAKKAGNRNVRLYSEAPFANSEAPATGGGSYTKLGYKPGSGADPWGTGNVTIHSWNRRLLDLVNENKVDEAKSVFQKMIDGEGPVPNIPTYYIMSNMFRKIPDYDAVKNLERMMNEAVRVRAKSPRSSKSSTPRTVQRDYHPKYRTGPWALLLALHRSTKPEGLNKEELIELASPFSDFSFTEPSDYHGFYTAWASMGTLIAKGLVERSRIGTAKEQNTLYVLTEDGKKRAELVDAEEKDPASAAVHAMAKDISSAVTFSGTSGESWFTTDLREKITGKIGLSEDEANELKTNLEKSKLSGEDNKRKQLASIILALHKKGGQKAIDSAVKRAKTPAEILDMVATLRSTDLMPQAN